MGPRGIYRLAAIALAAAGIIVMCLHGPTSAVLILLSAAIVVAVFADHT